MYEALALAAQEKTPEKQEISMAAQLLSHAKPERRLGYLGFFVGWLVGWLDCFSDGWRGDFISAVKWRCRSKDFVRTSHHLCLLSVFLSVP